MEATLRRNLNGGLTGVTPATVEDHQFIIEEVADTRAFQSCPRCQEQLRRYDGLEEREDCIIERSGVCPTYCSTSAEELQVNCRKNINYKLPIKACVQWCSTAPDKPCSRSATVRGFTSAGGRIELEEEFYGERSGLLRFRSSPASINSRLEVL